MEDEYGEEKKNGRSNIMNKEKCRIEKKIRKEKIKNERNGGEG